MDPKGRSSSSRNHSPSFGFRQENGGYRIFRIGAGPTDGASIMACHKQIAAEIDMHAEVLPPLGQRLDLVLHRIGQRRQANDALRVRPALEGVQERLGEGAVL